MNTTHDRILRAIAGDARTPTKLRSVTSAVPWPAVQAALLELIEMGHVSRGRGSVLTLTSTGKALIAPPPPPPMKPYVPPEPLVTRRGADDWRSLPSVVGGQSIAHKPS